MVLKLHVKLSTDNTSMHNEYEYGGNVYIKIEPQVYLTLECVGETWSKDKCIIITQSNIYGIIQNMKKVIDSIYNEDIFANKPSGEIIAYKDMVEKFTRKISVYGTTQYIMLKPSVIYDENDISYEGVEMYLNKYDNRIEMTIELFEALYYTLSKIDLFQYSQLLINYFASYKGGNINLNNPPQKISKPKVIFSEEKTEATYRPNKDKDNLFSGL